MTHFKIYEDSKNYVGSTVQLSSTFPLPGLDNLVGVSVFGNTCIIPKTYDLTKPYVFFPSETVLSSDYLTRNNLYRDPAYNEDRTTKGYFELNGRVKAIKLKGNKSTGVVMPYSSLYMVQRGEYLFGDFNEINGVFVCRKYIVPGKGASTGSGKQSRVLDEIVDSKMFPQHLDTEHLLKNIDRIDMTDTVAITIKLHGTSGRVANTLTKRNLKWYEVLADKLNVQVVKEEHNYVVGSRKVVKSVAFSELRNKRHFYTEDLWTKVAKQYFEGKLHKGEAVYFEIIGKDHNGGEIQKGYTYGYHKPEVFIYRITHINSQGIEIDLPFSSVITRARELGVDTVPVVFVGRMLEFLHARGLNTYNGTWQQFLEWILQKSFIDKPALLDHTIIEEGICLRVEGYPRPRTYKMKSPEFLIHEGKMADKEIEDVESQN